MEVVTSGPRLSYFAMAAWTAAASAYDDPVFYSIWIVTELVESADTARIEPFAQSR